MGLVRLDLSVSPVCIDFGIPGLTFGIIAYLSHLVVGILPVLLRELAGLLLALDLQSGVVLAGRTLLELFRITFIEAVYEIKSTLQI